MVLTCSTTEGRMTWLYKGVDITDSRFDESQDPIDVSRSLQASGFMFSAEIISKRTMDPVFASYHIEFQC